MANPSRSPGSAAAAPHLRRVLSVWDLLFYGIVLIQPTAPIPLFGITQKLSGGHTVTTILLAMLAMLITAVSYGRMAGVYPSAGSAYTYVSQELNPHLGFLVGWAILLDYILVPLVNVIWIAIAVHTLYLPRVPYYVAALLAAALMTVLNLRGVRTSIRSNYILLAAMCIVLAVFFVLGSRYLWHTQGWSGLFSTLPFYDPRTFHSRQVRSAISFAALTYIGFDGVTTLAEDAKNPRRDILMATVLVCLFTGILGALEVYLGQRIWPDWHTFPTLETAFVDVCARVGGAALSLAMSIILIVAAFGSGLSGMLGAARLLFGMGQDNVLPRRFFARLDKRTSTPQWNVLLLGVLAFAGAVVFGLLGNAFQYSGELINFGAFLAFMGVNFSAFWHFAVRTPEGHRRNLLTDAVLPLIGLLFCASIWWNLSPLAKIFGGAWFIIGFIYIAIATRGFRTQPQRMRFTEV